MMDNFNKLRFILLAFLVLQTGCAPKNWSPEEDGTYDPFEPLNRKIYAINSDLDTLALKPVAEFYSSFPTKVRRPLNNFYNNLTELSSSANHVFQQNGTDAVNSLFRFTCNSTLGIGGLFDLASDIDIERKPADFGQTFRAYGFDNSAYLVLIFQGPSSMADSVGSVFDNSMSPICCINNGSTRTNIKVAGGIVHRADLLGVSGIIEEIAFDEYSFVRDAYEEKRANEAKKISQSLIFKNPFIKTVESKETDGHSVSNDVWTITYDATALQPSTDDLYLSTQQ